MNFDEAIKAHSIWRLRLAAYLKSPDGSILPQEIQVDNRCALGQWIHGEGSKWSHLPEYETLKREHAHFHKAAAEVVRKADSGGVVTEDIALGGKSEFSQSSNAVISAIMAMRRKAEGA